MSNFRTILNEITDRLLGKIEIFDNGYAHARLDNKKGLLVTVGNEARYVGLSDIEGDYFYIRVPDAVQSSAGKTRTDCQVALQQKYVCSLVAVVKEADEFELADAVANELMKTRTVQVKTVWVDAMAIIENEFRGLPRNSVDTIKSRLGERILVRIDFEIMRIFESHNCNYNFCKLC